MTGHRGKEDPDSRSKPWTMLTPEVRRRMSWIRGAEAVKGVEPWTSRDGATGRTKWSLSSHVRDLWGYSRGGQNVGH